jgi:hypothetical protein
MTVRNMSAQHHKFFVVNWRFKIATTNNFKGISLDLSSPKAKVRGSNPLGRASKTGRFGRHSAECHFLSQYVANAGTTASRVDP